MKASTFEHIIAWQKAETLTLDVYKVVKNNRDYSFRDQIQRASVSIMNNIAEGFERRSNKEFKQYLYIAKGSCGEVRSMIALAGKLNYFTNEQTGKLYNQATGVSKILSGFIKKLT